VKVWVTTVILILFIMGGFEVALRAKGYPPSVTDDTSLWALTRANILPDDPNEIVVVGSSRIHTAINLDVFRDEYGRKPVQLALVHSSPFPILEDLADDPHFKGLVVCEFTPALFFSDDAADLNFAQIALNRRDAMADALFDFAETRERIWVESHFVSQSGQLQMEDFLNAMATGKWPEAANTVRSDRQRFLDASKVKKRLPDVPMPDGPLPGVSLTARQKEIIETAKEYILKLRAKGGDLVFVYVPCTGENKKDEILHYPRSIYWDQVLEETETFGIHPEDYESLAKIIPYVDYSHLDIDQAKQFTRGLARIFKAEYKRAVVPE
jgi:hypothetical protein